MSKFLKSIFILVVVVVHNILVLKGQFFEETNYIGAMGQEDWTKGWSDFTPLSDEYPEPKIPLTGIITKNTILSAANVYLLQGKVYVTNNATLYIERGTMIRCENGSALIITRGSRIRALGTKDKPIVFTSSKPANQRNKGDWGGVVILGKAPVNTVSGENIAEGDLDPAYAKYGGKTEDDCSGIMQYVRIEFAGKRLGKDNEYNGLTLNGVGNRTKLEYIQVSYSGDDGFQFHGGTVNAKYLISFQSADDCFEYSEGYRGKQQFCVALRHFNLGDIAGSRAIEAESYSGTDVNLRLITSPKLSNFTIISPEVFYGQTPNPNIKEAINLELGAAMSFHNSIIVGFPIGITIDGTESIDFLTERQSVFRNNLFVGCSKPAAVVKSNFDINTWFVNPEFKNVMRPKGDADKLFKTPFSMFKPDLRTNENALIVKSDFKELNKDEKKYVEFFEANDYRGAFGKNDWTVGWTNFNPDIKPVDAVNTITVSGNISSTTTWSQQNTYLLKGTVIVNKGATLVIEPGTVVQGDVDSKATLIVEPGAKIIAEGDVTQPIVFTSSNPKGKKKPGDWGGIIILGNGVLAPKKSISLKTIAPWLPEIAFGENNTMPDAEHILRYLRVEYAGFSPDKTKDMAAITFAALDNAKIDYLQVSYSLCDGIHFLGGKHTSRHIVAYNNTDDDIVISRGYMGKSQYALLWREPIMAALNGANAIEVSGCKSHPDCMVHEQGELSNYSIIGPNRKDVVQYNQNFKAAVLIKNAGSVSINNSLITSYPLALELQSEETNYYALSNQLIFKNNLISNCKELIKTDMPDPFTVKQWFMNDAQKKLIVNTYEDLGLTNTMTIYINYIPKSDSPAMNSEFESFNSTSSTY
ncbi:MAG: hypothetical protein NZ529_03800 [Cytophagaceae bacterium]|nr:hypothetical protein [Cytophagaceae bacterium]MDW8455895.1 hypothetical protein [Cytophagaceae bacterium]